jgi:ubiquinone/menaquinone biosynthesis C-methylase UbiE
MAERLYKDLVKYYDLIYHGKEYKKEATVVKKLISKYKKSKGKDLLEVACGTGRYLEHLKSFNCTGVDLNEEMLKIAKKRAPKAKLKKANMITLNLNKKYDVILCLFSSIGYVKTYSNLKKTIRSFSKHLKPGGVLIIEPWFDKKTCKKGNVHISPYQDDKISLVRMTYVKIKGNISTLEMHFMYGEKNKGITHFYDKHELGMFDPTKFLKILQESGIKAKYLKKGALVRKGTYVGVKQ